MTHVLITGGAGFIGSNLATSLAGRGVDVSMIDSLAPQIHGENARGGELYRRAADVGQLHVGDVRDRSLMEELLQGPDVVVHLAAETGTGQSMYEIDRYVDVNVRGTSIILDILATQEARTVKKVVVASSRSIYGEGRYLSRELGDVYPGPRDPVAMTEGKFEPTFPGDRSGLEVMPTTEDARIHPSSIYGITKQTQEQLVMTGTRAIGIAGVALRYQNVYGPGQSLANPYTGILSIFSNLIRSGQGINVFEDGLESRDFVYIDDVVCATATAVLESRGDNQVFNVGSGKRTTVLEVVEALMKAYGRTVPVEVSGNFRIGDIRHNYADLSRISDALGFRPEVPFAEGVQRFCDWVSSQPVSPDRYESSLTELKEKRLLK